VAPAAQSVTPVAQPVAPAAQPVAQTATPSAQPVAPAGSKAGKDSADLERQERMALAAKQAAAPAPRSEYAPLTSEEEAAYTDKTVNFLTPAARQQASPVPGEAGNSQPKGAAEPQPGAGNAKPAASRESTPAPVSAAREKSVPAAQPAPAAPVPPAAKPLPAASSLPPAGQASAVSEGPAGRGETTPKAKVYALKIGEYVAQSDMEDAKKKLQDAGVTPVVMPGPKKKVPMIRLLMQGPSPTDDASAQKQLDLLRKVDASGMVLTGKDGKRRVYAGSFFNEKLATQEQQRLAALGMKCSLQRVELPMSTWLLTAGRFPSREAALQEWTRLKKQGVEPSVIKTAK
jgi:hypothetical protein